LLPNIHFLFLIIGTL